MTTTAGTTTLEERREEIEKLGGFKAKLDKERKNNPDRPVIGLLEEEYEKRRSELAAELDLPVEDLDLVVEHALRGEPLELDEEGEVVSVDDTVIGRAFRWSLLVIVGAAAAVALVVFLVKRPAPPPPEKAIEAAPPKEVASDPVLPAVRFTDITRRAGITFLRDNGAYGDKLLPETLGGGAAFVDVDGDGDADLFLVNAAPWPWAKKKAGPPPTMALYENDGHGRFRDITRQAGLAVTFYGMGVAAGDYDGDGRVDLFVTAVGRNHLFHNLGGRFEDVTARAGVAGGASAWSTCATFFDYDGDGDLDLFVGNYVRWSKDIDFEIDYQLTGVGRAYGPPMNYEGSDPYLYRNDGGGRFTDVSKPSGVEVDNPATGKPMAKSLGVAAVDVDGDGRTDLLVANDTVGNFLFHNRGDGTFEEEGASAGLAYDRNGNATGAMGVDVGYFRNDADLGFLIGNFANEMTSVYVAQGDPSLFEDEAITEGIGAPSRRMLSFGVLLFDYDLDGRLDLLQTNGHLEEEIATVDPSQQYRQASQLFWNAGPDAPRGFVPVPNDTTGDLGKPLVGRGSAYADIDGDGDLDVVMTQAAGPPLLLRNDQALGHHWLRLRLAGRAPNLSALGARVTLVAGGVTQRRTVVSTRSYLSQSELPLTFGLGATATIDSIRITWPDGNEESLDPSRVGLDRTAVVEEGRGVL